MKHRQAEGEHEREKIIGNDLGKIIFPESHPARRYDIVGLQTNILEKIDFISK